MKTRIRSNSLKLISFFTFVLSASYHLNAQTQFRTVVGKVYSETDSLPISGVFVYPLGRTQGVSTDLNGIFAIQMAETDTMVVVSKPEYISREIFSDPASGSDDTLLVYMVPEKDFANTGYISKPRRDLSSVQSPVKGSTIENINVTSFDAALQGRVAGLHAISTSGVPGAAQLLRIRGINSPVAGTEPLIIIDGMPVTTGSEGDGGGMIGENYGYQDNPLADIDLNDIESIEVLKDAGALGIYGARGANGVILVKTKRGKAGRTNFNVGYYTGISQATNKVETVNNTEYLSLLDRAYQNTLGLDAGYTPVSQDIYTNRDTLAGFSRARAEGNNTDWMDKMLRTGKVTQLSVSAQGGTQRVNFYLAGNYRKEEGILKGNDIERTSLRFNADNQATDNLKIGIGNVITLGTNYAIPTGNYGSGFGAAQSTALPIYSEYFQGTIAENPYPFNQFFNPYSGGNSLLTTDRRYTQYEKKTLRNIGNIYGEYTILPNLKYRANFNFDYLSYTDRKFDSRYTTLYPFLRIDNPAIGVFDTTVLIEPAATSIDRRNSYFGLNLNTFLQYDFNIRQKHNFTSILGYELNQNIIKYNLASSVGFPSDDKNVVSLGAVFGNEINGAENGYRYYSYFSSTDYNYNKKYYANFSIRADASTRFGSEVGYVFSPTLSLGWKLTEESFINYDWLNFLKLRTSFGRVGNSIYRNNLATGYWKTGDKYLSSTILGTYQYSIASRNLTSEKSDKFDIGIDFAIKNSRIFGTIDYYNNTGRDIVLPSQNIPSAGVVAENYPVNQGTIRNSGVEVTLNTINIRKEKFSWSSFLTSSHNSSKVVDMGGMNEMFYPTTGDFILSKGEQIGSFYLPVYAGRDEQGREMIFDKNGNAFVPTTQEEVDNARVVIKDKSTQPKLFGGFGNEVKYRAFDLSVFFTYSLGNYLLDDGERRQSYVTGRNTVRKSVYEDLMNDSPDMPRVFYEDAPGTSYSNIMSQNNSTRFLHDASYVRLKTVTLGYTIPVKYSTKIFMNTVRVYLAAQNLLTFTSFKGWDPEAATNLASPMERGIGNATTSFDLPQVRSYSVGVNFNF